MNQNPVSCSRRQQSKVDNKSTTARQNQIFIVFLVFEIKHVYYTCLKYTVIYQSLLRLISGLNWTVRSIT